MSKTADEVRALVAGIQTDIEAVHALAATPNQEAAADALHAKLNEGALELAERWSDLFPDDDGGVYVAGTVASRSDGGDKEKP